MGFLSDIWDKGTDIGHALTGTPTADEKRNRDRAMNEQMKAYKEQTELTRQELKEKRAATEAEKRRVEAKQIRHLRRGTRAAGGGFLGSTQESMSSKLGG